MIKATPIEDGQMRHSTISFECKAASQADTKFAGEFEGYGAGIHNIDRVGDMIVPGAFYDGLAGFKEDGVICWQHDAYDPIGKPLDAYEDEQGLYVKARVSNVPSGIKGMTLLRDKVIKKMSIGYRVNRRKSDGTPGYEFVDRAGLITYLSTTTLAESKKAQILQSYDEMELDSLFLLKSIRLHEISLVTFPANTAAQVTTVKQLESLAGLSFAEHSAAALATVRNYTKRAQDIHSLRTSENRKNTLSVDRRAELQEVAQQLESLLKATAPKESVSVEGWKLHAEFLAIESRLNGVTI